MTRRALLLVTNRTGKTNTAMAFGALRVLAAKRGWQVAREFLATPGQPHEREALVEVVRSGLHGSGVVVCASLADLGTTVRNAVFIADDMMSRGWDVCTPEVDTTEPAVRSAMIAALCGLAGVERESIANRARVALDRARREGRQLGRKRREVPVDRVRELLATGRSWRDVARATGIPTSTLRTAMKRQPLHLTVPGADALEAA
jgi:DNA invertase Pin-like site-specific DNA recombinase